MVVNAHPDDAEFGCGGTIARWAGGGREVVYVVCTNGDRGSSDPEMTSERLAAIRVKEQRAAAAALGVKEVIFLGYPDGGLEDTGAFREQLVRLIRKHRPEIVLTSNPHRRPFQHRDHRIVGTVTLDAVFPYARDRLYYPEHEAAGLATHKVREVYLWGTDEPDIVIDITGVMDKKLAALRCHVTQVGHRPEEIFRKFVCERAAAVGGLRGFTYGEGFLRIEFPP